ncbi:hypothetical protein TWF730_009042 [Orbilia blumenaviensis]|uniref:Peptidase A1 domain-containing protein n=1 Tax=Orbilia blumenaviensis TaxID=1796055 RepID=A0AAV9V0G8_9PEZI
MGLSAITRLRVVAFIQIACFLLSFAYVAQQYRNTTPGPLISDQLLLTSSKARRAGKSHVVLLTEFSYIRGGGVADFDVITNITIGGNQDLRLSVTPQHITWVPQEPGSVVDFCNVQRNPQNERGCEAAGRSRYYKATGNTRTDSFSFNEGYLDVSINETATGYWVEDTIAADGIDVRLQFGVALRWHSSPVLGLGIQPVNQNQRRPGYIDALKQQGKITGRFCSLYNHMSEDVVGEIVLGGIDTDKFRGRLAVWQKMGIPGEVGAPAVRISNRTGQLMGPYGNPEQPLAVIDPLARALFIPNDIYEDLITELGAFGLQGSRNRSLGLPCDQIYAVEDILELNFGGTIIKIQFNHLKGIELKDSPGLCELSVFPTEIFPDVAKRWSFVLGGPFFRAAYTVIGVEDNSAGIGVLNPTPVGRNIIELGGNFGTSLDKIEGDDHSSSSLSAPALRLSPGGIAGVVIAVTFVLIVAIVSGVYFWRSRKRRFMPDIPLPQSLPPELTPDVRPMSELEAKGPAAVHVLHELPAYSAPVQELEANTNR